MERARFVVPALAARYNRNAIRRRPEEIIMSLRPPVESLWKLPAIRAGIMAA
jgi:hypothetical protein